MELNAHSIAETIDLVRFAEAFSSEPFHGSARELFYRAGKNSWFCVYSFGAVAFANVKSGEENEVTELAKKFAASVHAVRLSEDHTVETGKGRPLFETSFLRTQKITDAIIRIVLQNLAYSVTLEQYRRVSANLLETVKAHALELEGKGKIRLREKNLNKFIGRVLSMKNRIAEHFYIFADLDIIWEDDALTRIHRGMVQSLDLKTRHKEVENTFKIIEENLHMFNEFHMHGQSYRIEVIITLLIVIEVLDLIGDKFKIFH